MTMEPQRKRARLQSPSRQEQQQRQEGEHEPKSAQKSQSKPDLQRGISHELNRLSLFDLLARYPIRERLMQFLDTKDLLRLCHTSKTMKADIMANEWNINNRLKPFFKDPIAFRTRLGQSDALICGAFALQFLAVATWNVDGLLVAVQLGDHSTLLHEFLISERYKRISVGPHSSGLEMLWTYKQPWTRRSVGLLVGETMPLHRILCNSQTTAYNNFISWNRAFSLFPRPTFLARETIPLKPLDTAGGDIHARLRNRGWSMRIPQLVELWDVENVIFYPLPHETANTCPDADALGTPSGLTSQVHRITRRIGDHNTWILPLDTAVVKRSPVPNSVLEYSGFTVFNPGLEFDRSLGAGQDSWEEFGLGASYEIEAPLFPAHSLLRYSYTRGSLDLWVRIRYYLDRHALAQLWTLPESQRQQLIGDKLPMEIDPGSLKLTHLAEEDYFDDRIPQFFERWKDCPRVDTTHFEDWE